MPVLRVDTCFLQACADKLKREIADFGFPPKFPENAEKEETKQVEITCNILLVIYKS